MKDLPLNGRNFTQLIQLSAGAIPSMAQSTGLQVVQKRGIPNVSINGARHWQNNILIEGISNMENHNGNGILLYPSVDAILEFRVESSVADVQSGRGGGGTVNLVYKSGTKDFHGGLYWFLRNSAFDAKNYFDRPNDPIPPFRMNQFGAFPWRTACSPGSRTQTFFFVNYEGNRVRQAQTYISSVPKAEFRRGDFSTFSRQIFDPLTQRAQGNTFVRDQFPGNIIPASRLDQVGVNLLNLYPLPNLGSGEVNNFLVNPVRPNDGDRVDFKIDHIISPMDTTFVRVSRGNDTLDRAEFPRRPGRRRGAGRTGNSRAAGHPSCRERDSRLFASVHQRSTRRVDAPEPRQLPLTFGRTSLPTWAYQAPTTPVTSSRQGLLCSISPAWRLSATTASPRRSWSATTSSSATLINYNRGSHAVQVRWRVAATPLQRAAVERVSRQDDSQRRVHPESGFHRGFRQRNGRCASRKGDQRFDPISPRDSRLPAQRVFLLCTGHLEDFAEADTDTGPSIRQLRARRLDRGQ